MTTKNSVYVDAVLAVLTELGGGPIRSKDLVKAILERNLVPEGKTTYNTILAAARKNPDLFDTSKHGYVSLSEGSTVSAGAAASE